MASYRPAKPTPTQRGTRRACASVLNTSALNASALNASALNTSEKRLGFKQEGAREVGLHRLWRFPLSQGIHESSQLACEFVLKAQGHSNRTVLVAKLPLHLEQDFRCGERGGAMTIRKPFGTNIHSHGGYRAPRGPSSNARHNDLVSATV